MHSSTFHLIFLRIEEDSRPDVMMQFEFLHRFESNQRQTWVVKLLDGIHFIPLHHYLFPTIHLEDTQKVCMPNFNLNMFEN